MKKIKRDFTRICYVLFFLATTKSIAQEANSFKITPEISKKIMETYGMREVKIFPVKYKEIEYRPYDTVQVMTKEYKRALEDLNRYKYTYDEYNDIVTSNTQKLEASKNIRSNIDKFLNSNEKYDIKEKYLIESQNLADKCKLEIIVTEFKSASFAEILKNPDAKYQQPKPVDKKILLYEKGKKTKKNDLIKYQDALNKLYLPEPSISQDYRQYVSLSKELEGIKKTEIGTTLSDKKAKRMAYMIDEKPVDINIFSGSFSYIGENYHVAFEDIKDEFIKNEVSNGSGYSVKQLFIH